MEVLLKGRLQQCVQQCNAQDNWNLFEKGLGHRKPVGDDVSDAKHQLWGIEVLDFAGKMRLGSGSGLPFAGRVIAGELVNGECSEAN